MVMDIFTINGSIRVSGSHPIMVMEREENGVLIPKWKVVVDISIGDCLVGHDGRLVAVKTINKQWYDDGMEVLNLSTDCGVPFIVGNCIVRADNAMDDVKLVNAPATQKLLVA